MAAPRIRIEELNFELATIRQSMDAAHRTWLHKADAVVTKWYDSAMIEAIKEQHEYFSALGPAKIFLIKERFAEFKRGASPIVKDALGNSQLWSHNCILSDIRGPMAHPDAYITRAYFTTVY